MARSASICTLKPRIIFKLWIVAIVFIAVFVGLFVVVFVYIKATSVLCDFCKITTKSKS